jgi:sec-independent protein translocase protein TatB
MFNLSGSEIVFLLLIALIVLGPEKLPEAVRKFGKVYAEAKKMSTGFQTELKSALDEPMREMRETAEAFKNAANLNFDLEPDATPETVDEPEPAKPVDAIEAKTEVPIEPVASNQPPPTSGDDQHVADQLEEIEATIAAQRHVAETVEEPATE